MGLDGTKCFRLGVFFLFIWLDKESEERGKHKFIAKKQFQTAPCPMGGGCWAQDLERSLSKRTEAAL